MDSRQFDELLARFSQGKCTPEEEAFVVNWYNAVGKADGTSLDEEDREAIAGRIWAAINPEASVRTARLPFLKWAAIIAIPLLTLAAYYAHVKRAGLSAQQSVAAVEPAEFDTRLYNDDGEVRVIVLADGSQVTLQPSSELAVSHSFGGKTREVRLNGEAFFKVTRDPEKPFIVYAREVVTKVLGTSFNIRAYEGDEDITVAVKTGKVSVYANKSKRAGEETALQTPELILMPNQEMVYHPGDNVLSRKLAKEPQPNLPNPHLVRMQFENAPVSEIFEMLEENYGVEIHYDKKLMSSCKLNTTMSDEGLYQRIEVICKAVGASYTIKDGVIVIQSNGC